MLGQKSFQRAFQPELVYGSMTDFFPFLKPKGAGSLPPRPLTLSLSPGYPGGMLRVQRAVRSGCLPHPSRHQALQMVFSPFRTPRRVGARGTKHPGASPSLSPAPLPSPCPLAAPTQPTASTGAQRYRRALPVTPWLYFSPNKPKSTLR